ncbi:MAG: family 78 glycoside hydrolase catalytic domain [Planctomycetota bacterium]
MPALADFDAWQASWIGPDINQFVDESPRFGSAIRPGLELARRGGRLALIGTFHLPQGYPRCFGTAWLDAADGIELQLNGRDCPIEAGASPDEAPHAKLHWDALRTGDNEIRLIGDASRLNRGMALVARVHEADSGWHTWTTDARWSAEAASSEAAEGTARYPAEVFSPTQLPRIVDDAPRRAVELTRTFALDAMPSTARLHATGLGAMHLQINGKDVGRDVLTPGWTDFRQRLHFHTYDVTDLLRPGTNTVTATLGNGWWTSGMGWESRARFADPDEPLRLLFKLDAIDDTDHATPLIASDHDWAWRPSRITRDTIYHGQHEDLTLEDIGPWRRVALLDHPAGCRLHAAPAGPIRVIETLVAAEVGPTPHTPNAWRFDFGQNHAGRPRLRGTFPAGTRLKITFAEELNEDGTLYRENYRTAAATDVLTVGEDPVDWSPVFTYRGYRFAQLEWLGTAMPNGFAPDPDTLVSEVLHNHTEDATRFTSSQPLFDRIDRIVRWGLRSNLHAVPTDCPQRDERLGWTGDVNMFAATSCWLRDLHGFYTKWLDDLTDAQLEDGGVTHVAPSCVVEGDFVPHFGPAAPVWGDVIIGLADVMHRFYDDPALLDRLYEPMKRWVGWYRDQADATGLAKVDGFGDWVPVEETPPDFCGAAFYAFAARVTAEVADTLGKPDESAEFRAEARQAAEAFHAHYFDEAIGGYRPDTQTAHALPLGLEITPPPDRQRVADRLAKRLADADGRLTTGFVGTAYLLPTLSRYGHHEAAYNALHTTEYPSLGYMIDHGATTVWERWNSDKMGPDMNSRNHFCFGAMAQWLYEDFAGVRPDRQVPGFRRVYLRPRPAADASMAQVEYDTPHGTLASRWSTQGEAMRYRVTLPPNSVATLTLPAQTDAIEGKTQPGVEPIDPDGGHARFELMPGEYEFTCPVPADTTTLAPAMA